MKKWLLLLALAVIGVLTWYLFVTRKKPEDETPKQQPLAVSQHSDSFNVSMNNVLNAYYSLTDDFVKWDSSSVPVHANELMVSLDRVNFDELQKDTLIYQTVDSGEKKIS